MEVKSAITTAIAFEKKVRDVYADASKTVKTPEGRKVLEMLAKEEQQHIIYLQERLKEWTTSGKLTVGDLPSRVPSETVIRKGVERITSHLDSSRKDVADPESELRILERALHVETETSDFYQKMVDSLTDDARNMFSRFLEIEKGHLAIVKAEIDAVSDMGFWFGLPEFDLEIQG
ncbi:ferritin family protein [bacterium]|nr:ferritin family protein [candidate division CSSED10-310 bacterium]